MRLMQTYNADERPAGVGSQPTAAQQRPDTGAPQTPWRGVVATGGNQAVVSFAPYLISRKSRSGVDCFLFLFWAFTREWGHETSVDWGPFWFA
uniref:Uncharacterized protein n=1 Tax=Hordeum vulgare subsp. vulgare TaxID=112509 RepID=A0A8I6YBL0_HORVV